MSFRERRNFCEMLRSLGYPRVVSVESFRNPNFELVADCLAWLVERYDPSVDINDDITSSDDRIAFLKQVAQFLIVKARTKVNIKRLYQADGYAVKELLKVVTLLYKAKESEGKAAKEVPADTAVEEDVDANLPSATQRQADVKAVRLLATEITSIGAKLYDALGQEGELREARERALHRNMDPEEISRSIQEAVATTGEQITQVERMLQDHDKDESALDRKIEKRRIDLERSEKRLASLQGIRPQYMEEYERLQVQLQGLYAAYLERFRNLSFLEAELESLQKLEDERLAESEKRMQRMQKKIRDEELKVLRGELASKDDGDDDLDGDSDLAISESDLDETMGRAKRGTSRRPSGVKVSGNTGKRDGPVQGSLMGGADDSSGDDVGDDDAASDDTHVSMNEDEGSGDDELLEDDDDDDDLDLDEDDGDASESDNEF